MTYTYEQTVNYMNNCIDSMDHSIDWSINHLEDYTRLQKREWALNSINGSFERAFGAISLAEIYLKGITEEEADEMREVLQNAYFDRRDRIFEIDYSSTVTEK